MCRKDSGLRRNGLTEASVRSECVQGTLKEVTRTEEEQIMHSTLSEKEARSSDMLRSISTGSEEFDC